MKKLLTICFAIITVSVLLFAGTDRAYQETNPIGHSPYKGLCYSGTADLAATNIGKIYGAVYAIEIEGVGDTAFTVTLSHAPDTIGSGVTFASRFTKFTKTDCTVGNNQYALETTSINGNTAIGSLFTGDVYLTVSSFTEAGSNAWAINVIYKDSQSNQDTIGN